MKLGYKIFLYFGVFLFLVILGFIALNYFAVEQSLHENIQKNLRQSVKSFNATAETMLSSSIRNYLRGIIDQDMLVLEHLYASVLDGSLTEKEAKNAFQNHVIGQSIGQSGYIAAVKPNGSGIILDIHPFMRGQDCTNKQGCQDWISKKNGYSEYDWKNPADDKMRKKVGYIRYFEPWNWVVGSTSYKDEFTQLVQIEDLRQLIKPFKILERGNYFMIDDQYNVLIHSELEGLNVYNYQDKEGEYIFRELIQNQDDFFYYRWKSPKDQREEERFSFATKLENFTWYLVASGYVDDITTPIRQFMRITYFLIFAVALLLIWLTILFSRSLTRPLHILLQGLKDFDTERKTFKMPIRSVSEINSVGRAVEQITHSLVVSEKEKKDLLIQLNSIINSMPSILIVVDTHGKVILWNKKAEEYTGFSSDLALNKQIDQVLIDIGNELDIIQQHITAQNHYTSTYEIEKSDSSTQFFAITLYPLPVELQSAVIRIDDISERVQMEEELIQSRKMDAIGHLAGGVAHDFNNMLGGILGSVQIIEKRFGDAEKTKKYLKTIRETALRAADLTQKLLSFSRKNVRKTDLLNVHTVIEEAVDILKRSIDKAVEIRVDLQSENDVVEGDYSELQNAFMNMGINASHAMPEGGILIFRTSQLDLKAMDTDQKYPELEPGKYLKLEVEDTGVGIPEDIIDKVFNPFFTTKNHGSGTGLGLSSVYGTIKQLKGNISVSSKEDKGTLLKILLPLSGERPFNQDQTLLSEVTGSGTILVVEDEEILRITAEEILEDLGYKVFVAADGNEGIEVFQEHQDEIDLVMLDMIMPVMGGRECFQKLRKIDPLINVLIVSGFSRDNELEQMQKEAEFHYVNKPYDIVTLSKTISEILKS